MSGQDEMADGTSVPPDFASYVAARRTSLRRTAYLLTGDWDRAEDVVQDALTRLYVHWRRAQRSGSIIFTSSVASLRANGGDAELAESVSDSQETSLE